MGHLLTSYFKPSLSNVKQAGPENEIFLKIIIYFLLILYDKLADSFMDKDGITMTVWDLTNREPRVSVLTCIYNRDGEMVWGNYIPKILPLELHNYHYNCTAPFLLW